MSVSSLEHKTELQLRRRLLCWSSSSMYTPGFGNQPRNRTSNTGGPSSSEDAGRCLVLKLQVRRRICVGHLWLLVGSPDHEEQLQMFFFGSTDSTGSRRRRTAAGWPSASVSKPTSACSPAKFSPQESYSSFRLRHWLVLSSPANPSVVVVVVSLLVVVQKRKPHQKERINSRFTTFVFKLSTQCLLFWQRHRSLFKAVQACYCFEQRVFRFAFNNCITASHNFPFSASLQLLTTRTIPLPDLYFGCELTTKTY